MKPVPPCCVLLLCGACAFDANISTRVEMFSGGVASRDVQQLEMARIRQQLHELDEIEFHRRNLLTVVDAAQNTVVNWDRYVTGIVRDSGETQDTKAAAEARRNSSYNNDGIAEMRLLLYGTREPASEGATREQSIPALRRCSVRAIDGVRTALQKRAVSLGIDGRAVARSDTERAAAELAEVTIRGFVSDLRLVLRICSDLQQSSRKLNDYYRDNNLDLLRPAERQAIEESRTMLEPARREEQSRFVFFSAQALSTAFGTTYVEVIDPADPRLREQADPSRVDSDGKPVKVPGVLPRFESDPRWTVLFDETVAEGDGSNQFIIVQESPIHYRMKKHENDPSDVVSLRVSFAEHAMKIVGDVVGAAAAVYGISALSALGDDADLSKMSEDEKSAALATAKAKVEATQEIVENQFEAEKQSLAPLLRHLGTLAEESAALQVNLDAAAIDLENLEGKVAAAQQKVDSAQGQPAIGAAKVELAAAKQAVEAYIKAKKALFQRPGRIKQDADAVIRAMKKVSEAFDRGADPTGS